MVLRDGLRATFLGIACGIIAGLGLTRLDGQRFVRREAQRLGDLQRRRASVVAGGGSGLRGAGAEGHAGGSNCGAQV
jgi:hypothetical protein